VQRQEKRGEADDGDRTHDLRLGKPTLYQLSYVRVRERIAPDYRYSTPANFVNFSKAWLASIRRTVPDRERITIDSVAAPSFV
jgi:hypothetical protein